MKTADLFRQHADLARDDDPHHTLPVTTGDLIVALVCALAVIVALLMLGYSRPPAIEDADQAKAVLLSRSVDPERFEQLGAAYERGLHDAMQAIKDPPDALALSQVCLAMRGVR